MKDIFTHSDELDLRDFKLLKIGRHFRLGDRTKAIIGRDENDNLKLDNAVQNDETSFHWLDGNGPVGILVGKQGQEYLDMSLRILLRYTKAEPGASCRISIRHNDEDSIRMITNDITEETISNLRID